MKRSFLSLLVLALLAGCGGVKSVVITPIKETDKKMKCADLVVEINEAQFFVEQARNNRGLTLRNVIWPFGYPFTFMSSNQAEEAAQSRVDYLKQLYSIQKCDRRESRTISGRPARLYR